MKFSRRDLASFFAVLCFLHDGRALAAQCDELFISNRPASHPETFALFQLTKNGVSYFRLSSVAEHILFKESEFLKGVRPSAEDWDVPKFDAVQKSFSAVERQISDEIVGQLQSSLPGFSWRYIQGNGTGKGQGKIPNGAKTMMLHPEKYIEQWHRDAPATTATMIEQKFLSGVLNQFVLRVTIALPFGEVPPTLARAAGTETSISTDQLDSRFATAFIRDFVWHTTPQFEPDFRFLYIFDFEATKSEQ